MKRSKKLKKLTRSVFGYKNCPDWAQCAVVTSNGTAYWCRTLSITSEDPMTWCLTQSGDLATAGMAHADIWRKIGAGFDSSNWQHSMVCREPRGGVHGRARRRLTQDIFADPSIPAGATCAAVDLNGNAFWYSCDPYELVCGGFGWGPPDDDDSPLGFIGAEFDASDWKNSLIIRGWSALEGLDEFDDHSERTSSQADCLRTRDSGLPDSGRRESFDTGAVRDDAGDKPRPDLISPFFLERLGEHMRKGAVKYSEWNWAKGIPNSRCYASLMRHLIRFSQGLHDEDHLAAAAFNLMAIIHNEEVAKRGVKLTELNGLVDLPKFERVDDCDSK